MKKHLQTIVGPVLKQNDQDTNCRECQTSCQSACKTSCTVGNQVCQK
ncbi:MAG: six-cysteine peptide SCIFF [Syntrophomonadaceae bacterium]|nr:six-cysteine peptide SCIFF [Syntrophomonadaceae bacterium]